MDESFMGENKIYCERFIYISCRGNISVDYEIRKENRISSIVQFEDGCCKRVIRNVEGGYLKCSYDLLKLCDKSRIIDPIRTDYYQVLEDDCSESSRIFNVRLNIDTIIV